MEKELKQALLDFQKSAIKLTRLWDEASNEDIEKLNKDYPFTESFDEVVIDIIKWTEKK